MSENAKIDKVIEFNGNENFSKRDPQVILTGMLKESDRSEMIVFTIPLALFEIVCIVPIPDEGTKTVPVYAKFRVKRNG